MVVVGAPGKFYAGTCWNDDVDVATQRVRLDVELLWQALDLGQVDRHVAEYRQSDQVVLDVPRPGPNPFMEPPPLEDWLEPEQPSPRGWSQTGRVGGRP